MPGFVAPVFSNTTSAAVEVFAHTLSVSTSYSKDNTQQKHRRTLRDLPLPLPTCLSQHPCRTVPPPCGVVLFCFHGIRFWQPTHSSLFPNPAASKGVMVMACVAVPSAQLLSHKLDRHRVDVACKPTMHLSLAIISQAFRSQKLLDARAFLSSKNDTKTKSSDTLVL